MAKEVILPKFGNSVEECLIKDWHKGIGDKVDVDDVLCEVETDKTTMDVTSTEAGIILHVFYETDDVVKVLAPIAIVGEQDEDVSDMIRTLEGSTSTESEQAMEKKSENVHVNSSHSQSSSGVKGTHIMYSPRARAYLEQLGLSQTQFVRHFLAVDFFDKDFIEEKDVIDFFNTISISKVAIEELVNQDKFLAQTSGSGIGGMIVLEDIENQPPVSEQVIVDNKSKNDIQKVDLKGMADVEIEKKQPVVGIRKIISQRMMSSLTSTAQLTLTMQASAVKIREARAYFKTHKQSITINDIILIIVSRVLQENLWANSVYGNNEIISYKNINLSCAVQTSNGLMVPVIKKVEQKTLIEISKDMKEIAMECKNGTIVPEKLQGGTFTVTNVGAYGIQTFTPILNAPQTGILGIGAIDIRAIETAQGEYGFEPAITLSLTFDHRAYDGADGAMLLSSFVKGIAEFSVDSYEIE